MAQVNYFKVFFTTVLLIVGTRFVLNGGSFFWFDGANLVIHEAGHALFFWFGRFIGILGGTILQLFVPFVLALYFFIGKKEPYSASVIIFWLGQSFLNVSIYARDALKRELPLVGLGGGEPEHDWNNILFELGLLRHTETVANIIFTTGVLVIIAAIAMGYYYSFSEKEDKSFNE